MDEGKFWLERRSWDKLGWGGVHWVDSGTVSNAAPGLPSCQENELSWVKENVAS